MKNSNHHILTHMVGSCNTPDEAYRVLYFELEAQEHAYQAAMAGRLKSQAKKLKLENRINGSDEIDALEAKGEMIEFEADIKRVEGAIERAEQEIAFIKHVMSELEPYRKYRDLPLLEAFQACQAEEWAAELVRRARTFLLTQGTIPHDHFDAMVRHPWFKDYIAPQVMRLNEAQRNGSLLAEIAFNRPEFLERLEESHPELTAVKEMPLLSSTEKQFNFLDSGTVN